MAKTSAEFAFDKEESATEISCDNTKSGSIEVTDLESSERRICAGGS